MSDNRQLNQLKDISSPESFIRKMVCKARCKPNKICDHYLPSGKWCVEAEEDLMGILFLIETAHAEGVEQGKREIRESLFLGHGCEGSCLYGDDGEMQCKNPTHGYIDFKRDPILDIFKKLITALRGKGEK